MNRTQILEYIMPFLWACFSNMVYLYDIVKNAVYSKYDLLNNKSVEPIILFVKNGDEFSSQSGLKDDYDFILYKDPENDMIQIFDSIDDIRINTSSPLVDDDDDDTEHENENDKKEEEFTCERKISSVQFLTAEIQLRNTTSGGASGDDVDASTDADDWVFMQIPKQLYVSGNKLFSKAFLLWYINKYTSVKTYHEWHDYLMADEYQVSLLDTNVKNSVILPNQYVLLSENSYEIKDNK